MSKGIVMILIIILLNSCYYAQQIAGDIKDEYQTEKTREKNGGGAIDNEKYKEGVYEAIKDVVKRPMNNRVQYEGITLILPQGTSINQKLGNLIDSQTGYGIPIIFSKTNSCSNVFYHKKISLNNYCSLSYNRYLSTNEIAQKIIKANGFTKICN